MTIIDYSRFEKIQLSDDDDDDDDTNDEKLLLQKQFFKENKKSLKPSGYLYTIQNDTIGDLLCWCLDLNKVEYIHEKVPFGIHFFKEYELKCKFPYFISNNENKDTFSGATEILLYLFIKSLGYTCNLYPNPDVVKLQQSLDIEYQKATRTIYIYNTLKSCSPTTFQNEFIDCIQLPKYKSIYRVINGFFGTRLLLKYFIKRYFNLDNPLTIQNAYQTVDDTLENISKMLNKVKTNTTTTTGDYYYYYLTHSSINSQPSAADISFIVHSKYVFNDYIKTRASKVVLEFYYRMLKEERKSKVFGKFERLPSKYCKENNPWWANYNTLLSAIFTAITFFVIANGLFIWRVTFIVWLKGWLTWTLGLVIYLIFSSSLKKKKSSSKDVENVSKE